MTTKLRVRDLAAELSITNKDLLGILRDIGVPVRSPMSGLTEEDIERARDRHQALVESPQPVDTLAPSGVIVRKRRKEAEPVPVEDVGEDMPQEQTPEEAPPAEPVRTRKPRERAVPQAVIIAPAKVVAPPQASTPEEPSAEDAAPVQDTEPSAVDAEVATPSVPSEEAASAPQASEPEADAAPVGAAPVDVVDTDAVRPEEAEVRTEAQVGSDAPDNEMADEEKKQGRRRPRKSKPAPPAVQVKVISRPKIVA
ncbi:MAG: hypothetical protein GX055_06470, partial [Desulfovibrionales bacterium]|nr:hypothetical protein [Desulfovibrionales bacterium]